MASKFPQLNQAFPFRGLHEGVGYDIQPPGTTPDAVNVRAFDALKNRLRGGRRAGLSKYFAQQIAGNNVIQSISKAVEGVAYTSQDSDNAPRTDIDDDFSGYVQAVPTNTGINYTMPFSAPETSESVTARMRPCWGVDADGLILDNDNVESGSGIRLMLYNMRYEGPNAITATIKSRPQATNALTDTGAPGDCQCVGPYIRGSITRHNMVYACLIRGATDDSVTLQIRAWTQGTDAQLAITAAIALNNSAALLDGLEISMEDNLVTNEIVARVYWPGGGVSGTTIDEELKVTDTTHADNRCIGVGVYGREFMGGDIPDGSKFRTFTRIQAERFVYTPPNVEHSLHRTDAGVNRYYIPQGYTGYGLDYSGSGTVTTEAGEYDNPARPDGGDTPAIDTSTQAFIALNDTSNRRAGFLRTDPGEGPFDPEFVLQGNRTSGPKGLCMFVAMDAAFTSGIMLQCIDIIHMGPGDEYDALDTGVTGVWAAYKLVDGDLGDVLANFPESRRPFHAESVFRLVRTGDDSFELLIDEISTGIAFTYDTGEFAGNRSGVGEYRRNTAGTTNIGLVDVIRWRNPSFGSDEDSDLGKTSSAKLIVVSGGTVTGLKDDALVPVTNGDGALVNERFQIQAQSAYNRTFFVDGTHSKVYNLTTNQIDAWTATQGTLPEQTRLMALYRGRIVLSGTTADPHNWFMSKVGDPFDWDYSPADTSPIQAVAGNNSETGLVGDIITALIPFTDDIFLFGGDHTLWAAEGDPAAGGAITLVSDKTGVAWGKAWAKDPNGVLYFWGQDGVYRFDPVAGAKPENMTRGLIDNRILSVDRDFNRIWMEWNFDKAELHILITPADIDEVCRWLVWESRSNSWWEDIYPTAIGPNMLFAYDSALVNDRAFILGSRDGYLRKMDASAATDDGTDIVSRVRFEPFLAQARDSEVKLARVYPVLAAGSGPVRLKVYTGQTAEGCVTSTSARIDRLLSQAGRNPAVMHKLRGYAVQIELEQTTGAAWALESLSVGFRNTGIPRRQRASNGG